MLSKLNNKPLNKVCVPSSFLFPGLYFATLLPVFAATAIYIHNNVWRTIIAGTIIAFTRIARTMVLSLLLILLSLLLLIISLLLTVLSLLLIILNLLLRLLSLLIRILSLLLFV